MNEERKSCPKCGKPLGDLVIFNTETCEVERVVVPNFYCTNCKLTVGSIIRKMYEKIQFLPILFE